MQKRRGRPPKAAGSRYTKIHVTVDSTVAAHLKTVPNKSDFINQAALILIRAIEQCKDE